MDAIGCYDITLYPGPVLPLGYVVLDTAGPDTLPAADTAVDIDHKGIIVACCRLRRFIRAAQGSQNWLPVNHKHTGGRTPCQEPLQEHPSRV